MTLPTNPLELAAALYDALEDRSRNGRQILGIVPSQLDFAEVENALDAASMIVESDSQNRRIEFAPPGDFFFSLEDLLSSPDLRVRPLTRFYVADQHFLVTEGVTDVPEDIQQYIAATKFFAMLAAAADHCITIGSIRTLFFLQTEKLEITPIYSKDDLCDLTKIDSFDSNFVNTDVHAEQKKVIVKTVLLEMFKGQGKVEFAKLLWKFGEFLERVNASYELYVSEFSFSKVKAEIEKEKLDATAKLNKVFSDIQNQLLAVPAALILIGGQMENRGEWTVKNILIWLGSIIFSVFMTLLLRNQRNTLKAVKQEIDQQWQQIEGKYQTIAPRFQDIYQQLDLRYRHQEWLIRTVSSLVALSLAVATGLLLWFSVEETLAYKSVYAGFTVSLIFELVAWMIMRDRSG